MYVACYSQLSHKYQISAITYSLHIGNCSCKENNKLPLYTTRKETDTKMRTHYRFNLLLLLSFTQNFPGVRLRFKTTVTVIWNLKQGQELLILPNLSALSLMYLYSAELAVLSRKDLYFPVQE